MFNKDSRKQNTPSKETFMNDDVESVVLDLLQSYRAQYRQTNNAHYKYIADKLSIAHKELKQYHKLQRQMFPNFRGKDE